MEETGLWLLGASALSASLSTTAPFPTTASRALVPWGSSSAWSIGDILQKLGTDSHRMHPLVHI